MTRKRTNSTAEPGDSASPLALSVILCTRNPRREYLTRVLDSLRAQGLRYALWELVVVDNCSSEPLKNGIDLRWHPRARLIREDTLGLTPARLTGIREAEGSLLVFVDDDNLLDPDYLETVIRVAERNPHLGSWSGQCRPGFETEPPAWTRRYWGNLVIREFETDKWSNLPRLPESMPCGAGLCVRREVAQHYLHLHESGRRKYQFDRTGDSLASGGDNDLAGCACDLGFGIGLVTGLKLTHLIPPERLTADYLARLAEGIHRSSTLLDSEYGLPVRDRTVFRKAWDWLVLLFTKSPHRAILRAAHRGRDSAVRSILNSREN